MELYGIPQGVSAVYTYKGIRLTWNDLPPCSYYTVYLNLENDPKHGEYKAISGVIDTPNEYTIQNNLIRERTIIPYVKIYGYINNPTYTLNKTDSASGEIYAYTDWVQNGATAYGVNSPSYLSIPTYEGSGQAMHPDVLYFADSWNGYHYWMAYTPYPNGDANSENPSIAVSNDGLSWITPPGLTNPIINKPSTGHNSDTELYFENNTLYLIYRAYLYQDILLPPTEYIYILSSTDGVNWTNPNELISKAYSSRQLLSPAIVKNADKYRIYTAYSGVGLQYYESDNLDSNYPTNAVTCILDWTPTGKKIWHINITQIDSLYIGIFTYCDDASLGDNSILYYAISNDGLNWKVNHTPLLDKGAAGNWDEHMVYRSSLVYDGAWKLYYSGEDNNGDWHTGLTTLTPDLITTANKIHIYNDSDNYNLSIDSISDGGPWSILHSTDTVPDWTDGSMYIVDPINNNAIYGPFTIRYKPRKVAIEIARRLDVLFKARYKEAALVQVWHRRRHGEHCTCWDQYEGAVTDPNCELCYGVGFKGGYVGPEEMYITYGLEARNGSYNSFGEQLNVHDTLITGIGNMDAYVMPNDIIIDALGNRYTVTSVSYSSIDKSVIVSQRLGLQKLPRNDIVYKLGS